MFLMNHLNLVECWTPLQNEAVNDFKKRIAHYEDQYQTLDEVKEPDLSFMKIFNCGKKVSVYQHEGHIQSRIVYFLMNLQVSQVRRRGQSYDEFSAPDNLLVPPWSEWVQRSRQTWWGQRADWVWQVGETRWSEIFYHLANVRQYSRKLGEYINSLEVTNQLYRPEI